MSIKRLWADYVQTRQLLGYMKDGGRRQVLAIKSLTQFVGHDDATRVTKKNLADWLENTLKEKQPSTLSKVYLPKVSQFGKVLEGEKVTAAKRWVPWLCAFTGARVAEITQLRREDFRKADGSVTIRITPEAGGTKTGQWRDVPLHPQIIALGFLDYLHTIESGPVFHNGTDPLKFQTHAKKLANRIGDWLREENLVPEGVQPSHGWRHRFKTVGREIGIQDRVLDAIQGHAARTAGDSYGDVTLATKIKAIQRLPEYQLQKSEIDVVDPVQAGPET